MLAAIVVLIVSDLLDLELEAVALLGVAVGAIVALVPDRTAAGRLVGFLAGFVAAWAGYLARAALLPDSLGGRILAAVLVLGICVVVAGAAYRFVPLWAPLLGVATLIGGYEQLYSAAPPEVVSTSMSTATSLLMASAVGFLVAGLVLPARRDERRPAGRAAAQPTGDNHSLNDMMEKSK